MSSTAPSTNATQTAPALNPARVGFRYPTYTYEVGRETVRAFAAATRVTDGRYYDDPAQPGRPRDDGSSDDEGHDRSTDDHPRGAGRPAVPPAFVACVAGARAWEQVLDDDELGAHDRLMHVGQEFTFTRPVYVGDVLWCTPVITDIKALRGVELLTLEVTCADGDGAAVVTSRSRLMFLERAT